MAKKLSKIQQAYLVVYNLALFAIHLLIFVDLIQEKFKKQSFNFNNHYQLCLIGTFAQYIDVINAYFGLTSTNILIAFLQVNGRICVLYLIEQNFEIWTHPTTYALLVVYATIELIRYPFYLFKTLNTEVLTFTWLRYNAWLVLYPIGFLCEAVSIYQVFVSFYKTKQYLIKSPFGINFNIDLAVVAGVGLFLTFPYIVLTLLRYMWRQRQVQNRNLSKKIR